MQKVLQGRQSNLANFHYEMNIMTLNRYSTCAAAIFFRQSTHLQNVVTTAQNVLS
jgi:hypothetical protein